MKWIKKNKFMIIAIIFFIVISVVGYKALMIFFPSTNSAIYGDRLDGKINVKKEVYDGIKTRISGQEFVKDVSVREKGRTVNIVVTIMDSTSKDAAKGLTNLVLEGFNESQIGYYDFQVYIKKEDKNENDFPIIAYKQHNSAEFVWSRDREKTVEEDSTKEG